MINQGGARSTLVIAAMLIVISLVGCGGSDSPSDPTAYKVNIFNGWPRDDN